MLIFCPSCATSYDADLASLQPNRPEARCPRCREAEPTRAERLLAAAAAIASDFDVARDATRSAVPEAAPAAETADAALPDLVWPAHAVVELSAALAHGQPSTALVTAAAAEAAPAAAEHGGGSEAPGHSVMVKSPLAPLAIIAPITVVDLDAGGPLIDLDADYSVEPGDEPYQDIETYAPPRQRRHVRTKSRRWPLSRLHSGILALLIADAVLVGWRSNVVRVLPQTASFYAMMGLGVNLRGLDFAGVATTTERHDGGPTLVVQGHIVNDTRRTLNVPRLKFAARNAVGDETYSWTIVPPRSKLPPGETVGFRTQVTAPPADVRDVLVRFVTRHDVIAAIR